MKYRNKKPVVVEATQWFKNGDHPEDYSQDQDGLENGELRVFTGAERRDRQWEGGVVRYYRRPDDNGERLCEHCSVRMHEHGWIDTKEGGHIVCHGDWVITGVAGKRYPCKDAVFKSTYEPADESSNDGARPIRTITIEIGGQRGLDVVLEDGSRCNGMAWDEMLGQIAELTYPEIGTGHYPMKTAEQWAADRKARATKLSGSDTADADFEETRS